MLKLATIAGVLVLTVGAYAADKPAAAARAEMEGSVPAVATESAWHGGFAGGASTATKPAVTARLAAEAGGGGGEYIAEVPAKHEAVNVGFTGNKAAPAYEAYTAPSGGSGKAAVDFRLNQGK